jgi:hypothetical protein
MAALPELKYELGASLYFALMMRMRLSELSRSGSGALVSTTNVLAAAPVIVLIERV